MRSLICLRQPTHKKFKYYLVTRVFKKRLFKAILGKSIFPAGAPLCGHKILFKFNDLSSIRKSLKCFSLFQKFFWGRYLTKKKQPTTKIPGLFLTDPQEEKTLQKDEATPPTTRRRGKKYIFTNYKFSPSPYSINFVKVPSRRYKTKSISLFRALLPGFNFVSAPFFYRIVFKKPKLKHTLKTYFLSTISKNFLSLSTILNFVLLMMWFRRLFYIQLIINAHNSSNSDSR